MDKMERDSRNKTLYRSCFNYALSKLIEDNGLEDLLRRENTDSSEFTHYNRFYDTRSWIDRVYIDIKIASNIKINHIMVSFTDLYNTISFYADSPQKLKLEKIHGALIILFYVSLSSP